MKILTVFPWLSKFGRYIPQMQAISERIDEFHVAYCSGEIQPEWRRNFIFHRFMRLDDHVHDKVYSQAVRWLRYFWTLYLLGKAKYGLKRLSQFNVDLYYVLSGYFATELTLRLARKMEKPCVLRLRGNYDSEIKSTNPPLERVLDLHRAHSYLEQADLIIPISRELKNWALSKHLSSSKVTDPIALGVDTQFFKPQQRERNAELIVGYCGRLTKEKGVDRLRKVVSALPDKKFLIVGRKQTGFRLAENAKYIGWLPFRKMPLFYSMIDLLILPSYSEGFPNVLLEAYASGKPVVATAEAMPRELKVFGRVGDINEFPSLINELARLDLQRIGEDAREYVAENFSWNHFGEAMVEQLSVAL